APKSFVNTSDAECQAFADRTGCSWTSDWSCPGQKVGRRGIAAHEGMGFECCCTRELWKFEEERAMQFLPNCSATAFIVTSVRNGKHLSYRQGRVGFDEGAVLRTFSGFAEEKFQAKDYVRNFIIPKEHRGWYITPSPAVGKVIIQSSHANMHWEDRYGHFGMSWQALDWQRWNVSDAGNGRVFFQGFSGKYLREHEGNLIMSENQTEDEMYKASLEGPASQWTLDQLTKEGFSNDATSAKYLARGSLKQGGNGWCLGSSLKRMKEHTASWEKLEDFDEKDGTSKACEEKCTASSWCVAYMTKFANEQSWCDIIEYVDTEALKGVSSADTDLQFHCFSKDAAIPKPYWEDWPEKCSPKFVVDVPAPAYSTALNGLKLTDVCIKKTNEEHEHTVMVLGDWGGLSYNWQPPKTADNSWHKFPNGTKSTPKRPFLWGVDSNAQMKVAGHFKAKAALLDPDYVLNAGDSFYWGGINTQCGKPPWDHVDTRQWGPIFEFVYNGPGLDGKPWLGVLGNHDYGGFQFNAGWDQIIGRTWGGKDSTNRWIMPGQYYQVKVYYPEFSVDYYFVDTNVWDSWPHFYGNEFHNICGSHSGNWGASCGASGPYNFGSCPSWFKNLWQNQMKWLDKNLENSSSTWQIVVTHFPPIFGSKDWNWLSAKHGIDLFVSGHVHSQYIIAPWDKSNPVAPTACAVSGGGGGITSNLYPNWDGNDDAYGFQILTLKKDAIRIETLSHAGVSRRVVWIKPRPINVWDYYDESMQPDWLSQEEDDKKQSMDHNMSLKDYQAMRGSEKWKLDK
ncbi:unnamed protein product, partial [Polarella glacialis]